MSAKSRKTTQKSTPEEDAGGGTIEGEIGQDEKTAVDDADDGGDEGETDDEGPEKSGEFIPEDSLVERAVKSGLTISDAKAFKSKEALERVCAALEKNGGRDKKDNPSDDDYLAGLDLDKEGDWDEGVVKYSQSVKSVFTKMKGEIDGLKAALAAARESPDGEGSRATAEQLKKRASMSLQRPGNGAAGSKKTLSGDEADKAIAEEVDEKFF